MFRAQADISSVYRGTVLCIPSGKLLSVPGPMSPKKGSAAVGKSLYVHLLVITRDME